MHCTKCGKELVEGKCPVCDTVAAEGAQQDKPVEQKAEKRIKKEKKVKEPKEKKAKEPMTKRKKKILFISLAGGLVLAAAVSVLVVYFVNDAKYSDAIALLNDEHPKEAAASFAEQTWFKDSEEYLLECNNLMDYWEAKDTMEDNNFEDAIPLFAALEDYKDSETLTQFCQDSFNYETAEGLFDSGEFAQAQTIFLALEEFESSKSNADACQVRLDYAQAMSLYENDENLAAKLIFENILDYEDSENMMHVCAARLTFDDAVAKMGAGEHEAALELLDSMNDDIEKSDFSLIMVYNDFMKVRGECFKYVSYNEGVAFMDQELFYSAFAALGYAGDILDAKELQEACKQPIESTELYVNPDYERNSVPITFTAPKESGRSICIKIYSEDGDLVSFVLIEASTKLRIKLPRGTYTFNIGAGLDWFGEEEAFGENAFYYTMIMDKDGGITWKLKSNYRYYIKFEAGSGGYGGNSMNPGDF